MPFRPLVACVQQSLHCTPCVYSVAKLKNTCLQVAKQWMFQKQMFFKGEHLWLFRKTGTFFCFDLVFHCFSEPQKQSQKKKEDKADGSNKVWRSNSPSGTNKKTKGSGQTQKQVVTEEKGWKKKNATIVFLVFCCSLVSTTVWHECAAASPTHLFHTLGSEQLLSLNHISTALRYNKATSLREVYLNPFWKQ